MLLALFSQRTFWWVTAAVALPDAVGLPDYVYTETETNSCFFAAHSCEPPHGNTSQIASLTITYTTMLIRGFNPTNIYDINHCDNCRDDWRSTSAINQTPVSNPTIQALISLASRGLRWTNSRQNKVTIPLICTDGKQHQTNAIPHTMNHTVESRPLINLLFFYARYQ